MAAATNGDVESRGGGKGGSGGGGGGYAPPSYASAAAPYYHESSTDRHWTAWIVPMFVVANVAVFLVTMFINNCPKKNDLLFGSCVARFLGRFSFQPLRENPLFGPSSATLEKLGALEWNKVVHGGQGWRLVTCIWLHAGVIHLLANMFSLVFIGIRLEQQFGFGEWKIQPQIWLLILAHYFSESLTPFHIDLAVRIGIIYLLSGFGGSILSSLFIRNSISVGASGALFGLLGAMLSELVTNWTLYSNKAAALITLLVIVVINLAVGILPHVDNFAHIGGFLTGFLLGFVFLIRPQFGWIERGNLPPGARVQSKHKAYQYALWLVAAVLLIAGLKTDQRSVFCRFAVGLAMLFRGENGNKHCSWCHYLSCVPTIENAVTLIGGTTSW
ncbi:RHOMBOID-like protein 3 [Asimina triloba]